MQQQPGGVEKQGEKEVRLGAAARMNVHLHGMEANELTERNTLMQKRIWAHERHQRMRSRSENNPANRKKIETMVPQLPAP